MHGEKIVHVCRTNGEISHDVKKQKTKKSLALRNVLSETVSFEPHPEKKYI